MNTEKLKDSFNAQILEEASEWLVEFETEDENSEMRQNFDAWLRQSPEHVRAYLELLPIWKQGPLARFARDAGPESLIAFARSEDNVVSMAGGAAVLRPALQTRLEAKALRLRSHRRSFAMAATVLITLAGVLLSWIWLQRSSVYVTDTGEQHSVLLPDGSMLEMNARSKVRTRFSGQERRIELLQGQALFRVAADPTRPFVVHVGSTRVRAVGTQFDVYRKQRETVVTVVEGRVAVSLQSQKSSPAQSAVSSLVSAGEQIEVPTGALRSQAPRPKRANVFVATAWTQRRLVFDDSSLVEVVEEFNRYNRKQLVIRDPVLNELPISGSFWSTNPASLIRFLEAQPGIRVIAESDEIQIYRR